MGRYAQTTIMDDETRLSLDYNEAAIRLGITVQSLRNRICAIRKANPGDWEIIWMSQLRPAQRALTVLAIDDRTDTENLHVFTFRVAELVELVGLSRPTVFRRLKEYRLLYPGQPIKLKAFMRFAHSARARDAVHRVFNMKGGSKRHI